MKLQGVSPVLLSASVDLASGATAQPDMDKLSSPFRTPMVITEIRFMSRITDPGDYVNMTFSLRVALRVGRFSITDVPTPISMFGTSHDALTEQQMSDNLYVAGQYNVVSFNKWLLPKPLFLRPGESIIPQASRTVDGYAGTARLWITYAGYMLAPGTPTPEKLMVPYVGVWMPSRTASTSISDGDFSNPFKTPLRVQRFIGRLFNSTDWGTPNYEDIDSGWDAGALMVRMSDSQGYNVVRDFTPFSQVFQINRRVLPVKRTLAPGENFTAQLQGVSATSPAIALIGHRAERLDP